MKKNIKISDIQRDVKLQARTGLNSAYIEELHAALVDGAKLPPIEVWSRDGGAPYFLSDGWHRIAASEAVGYAMIQAEVEVADQAARGAFLQSLKANEQHGLRRTIADKRRAVKLALTDSELKKLSDRDLAERCSVSHTFVSQVRTEQELEARAEAAELERVADGTHEGLEVPEIDYEDFAAPSTAVNFKQANIDKTGYPIPEDIQAEWLRVEAMFKQIFALVNAAELWLAKGLKHPRDIGLAEITESTLSAIVQVATDVKCIRPHAVCPTCQGTAKRKTCKLCRSRGFISKYSYEHHVPGELKADRKGKA